MLTKIEPIEQVEVQELFLDITAHQEVVKHTKARLPLDIVEHAVAPHLEHLLIKVQEVEPVPALIEVAQEVRQVEVAEAIAPRAAPAEVQAATEVQEALRVLLLAEGHLLELADHLLEAEDHQAEDHQAEVVVDNRPQKFH